MQSVLLEGVDVCGYIESCARLLACLCASADLEPKYSNRCSACKQQLGLDAGCWKLWWPSRVVLCGVFSLGTDYKIGTC